MIAAWRDPPDMVSDCRTEQVKVFATQNKTEQERGNSMKTVKLSEQSLKLIETLCDYTENPDILNEVADALYYDAYELKRRLNQLAEEVK